MPEDDDLNFFQKPLYYISNLIRGLGAIPAERKIIETRYPIEKELIETNKAYNKLAKKYQTRDAELSEAKAEIAELKGEGKEERKRKKNEKIRDLIEQQNEIELEKIGETLSLNKFFMMIYGVDLSKNEFSQRSAFGKEFEFSDRDDKTSWGFGEILLSPEKRLVIATDGEGKTIAQFPSLFSMFYKPESLPNQIRRGRILLNIDEEGHYVPEFDSEDAPEGYSEVEIGVPAFNERRHQSFSQLKIIFEKALNSHLPKLKEDSEEYNELKIHSGEILRNIDALSYEESENLQDRARNLVIKYSNIINGLMGKLQAYEIMIGKMKTELNSTKRGASVVNSLNKNMQTGFTEAMNMSLTMNLNSSEMQRNVVNLSEAKVLLEQKIIAYTGVIQQLLEKIKEVGDMTEYERMKAIFEDATRFVNANVASPQQIVLQEKNPKVGQPS